ncbi:MAG: nucleotidyltransferase domain-containing protein [archaeon]
MISQAFTQNCFKIITLFSLSPGSNLNRTEIKNKTRLNNVPLDNALTSLTNSGILKKKTNYSINFEHDYSKPLLELCKKQYKQLKELPLNAYFPIIDLTNSLSKLKDLEIILFGSYSKLIYTTKSDIDLALLHSRMIDKKAVQKTTQWLEKTYGINIEIHYFDKEGFYKNKKDPLVKEILKNGVKLSG